MSVRILTDSSCDLSQDYIKANKIEILPLKVVFGEESFDSGVNLSTEQFYERLEKVNELPKTSQVAPSEMTECFQKYTSSTDEVVAVFISGKMSGTYQSAYTIKEELGARNIHIVDSCTVTFALGLLVMEAVRLRAEGLCATEIQCRLEKAKNNLVLYAAIGNLRYLQMGGRMSSTVAFIGTMLNVKPIITIEDGLVHLIDKQRGTQRAYQSIMKLVDKAGIDETRPRAFGHSNCPEIMQNLIDFFNENLPGIDSDVFARCDIGPTVGVHAGPGATGIAFFKKK